MVSALKVTLVVNADIELASRERRMSWVGGRISKSCPSDPSAKINETDTFGPGDDDEIQFDDIGDDDDDIDDVSVQDADGDLCVWVGWGEGGSVSLTVIEGALTVRLCACSSDLG